MRKRRKTTALLLALLAVALLAVLAAGCGGDDEDEATPTATEEATQGPVADPDEPVEVTFASWVGNEPNIKKLARQFQKQHPNITIKFQNVPAKQAAQKLTTQIACGNPPDAAYVDAGTVADFASRGALVPLDDYFARSEIVSKDDFVEAFNASNVHEGKQYGIPFDGESTGLFYRTDLFEQADIDGPPKTWEEFEAAAKKLTIPAKKQYGYILFATEAAYYWYPWLWQAGGDVLSEDAKEVAFDSPEAKEAAEFYVGLVKYSPKDFLNSNSYDGRVAFATGKVAMYMAGAWFGGEMKLSFPQINGKWDVAPLPEGPEGCATQLAGDALAVFSQTENADAAWLWIEFLSRPENMKTWTYGSKTSTLLPPRQSLLDDPELGKFNPWLEGFAENMKCAVTSNVVQEKWGEVEWGPLNQKLGEAIYGDISPEEALEVAAREGQKILDGEK